MSETALPRDPTPPLLRSWTPTLFTGLCFLASAMAGLALSRSTDGIAAFWPSNGIFLSALLLAAPENRLRHLLCWLVASVVSNAWAGAGWGVLSD